MRPVNHFIATYQLMNITRIDAQQAKQLLNNDHELAFIDVREPGQYGEGHPFFVVNLPYSRLEIDAPRLLPNPAVQILLLDDNDGVADKAARRLDSQGYHNLLILDGGAEAWAAAGFTLFKGVNVPSKAFGEMVEHALHTPSISAEQLAEMQRDGSSLVLLDGRTAAEYHKMNIPGARSCPNAELAHRLPQLIENPEQTIVINCAGRTRSIIGAQSLRNLNISNPIVALRNGTQGWRLAGFELQHGSTPEPWPALDKEAYQLSCQHARQLIERFQLPSINHETLLEWQNDPTRTLYLFDVRSASEFAENHLSGAIHAPGGQLVQATDQWVAVRHARIVLTDDTCLRAASTALWLRAMGHEIYILASDVSQNAANDDSDPATAEISEQTLAVVELSALAEKLSAGALLIDLSPSKNYQTMHIEGAVWSIRPRLDQLKLNEASNVILCAADAGIAELAAIDLRELGCQSIARIDGNPDAWRNAGLALKTNTPVLTEEQRIDYLFFVHDRHDGNLEAAQAYLDWELNLVNQLDEQERSVFNSELR